MSSNPTLKYRLLSVAAFLFAIFISKDYWMTTPSVPATSPVLAKKNFRHSIETQFIRHTEKVTGSLKLEIKNHSAEIAANEPFNVDVTVYTTENLETALLRVSVPDDIEIVQGSLAEQLAKLTPDKPQVIHYTFISKTGENRQIHFTASASVNENLAFSDVAKIETKNEQILAAKKKSLIERSKAYSKEKMKVFH